MTRYLIYLVYAALVGIGVWWLTHYLIEKTNVPPKREEDEELKIPPDDGPI